MTATPAPRALNLATLSLAAGSHNMTDGEMGLLEAVGYLAGEEWSNHPRCVCPVLGAFGRRLNDRLPYSKRQRLVPLIPELVGTAGDGYQQARGYVATDWVVRTYLHEWLKLTDRIPAEAAKRIAQLPPIADLATVRVAGAVVREIREQADQAREQARTELVDRLKGTAYATAYVDAAYGAAAYARALACGAAAAYADTPYVDAAYVDTATTASAVAATVIDAAVYDAVAAVDVASVAAAADDLTDPSALRTAARAAVDKALAPAADRMWDSVVDFYAYMTRLGRDGDAAATATATGGRRVTMARRPACYTTA